MKLKQKLAALLFAALITLPAAAQEKQDMFRPETSSVTSQSIAPDARAGGMGDIGAATDPDVVSQYWNPAKYPFTISRAGVSLNYTPWLRRLVSDMDLAYLSGYYRIGDYSAVSASLRYFSLGEVYTNTGETNDNSMTINPYEMSADVAYSIMLSETFSIAAAVRWIYSDLTYDYTSDTSPGSAFAVDLAAYYQNYVNIGQRECQLGLGLNMSNIGSKINFGGTDESEFIPANLRLGASLMIPLDEYNRITIAADANKPLVPTMPVKNEGETNEQFEQRKRKDYYDLSSISGVFKIQNSQFKIAIGNNSKLKIQNSKLMKIRTGLGYDVHKLVEGRELWLGGIRLDYELGLLGHSDADVLIHAICDALLGAANMRDIGYHFPDTAAETLNVDSKILLRKTVDLIATKGYRIGNVDATVCAERPKLNPHIPEMQRCLADVMQTDIDNVSIKATTTEKLGFTGRMEGISAYATVLIEKD